MVQLKPVAKTQASRAGGEHCKTLQTFVEYLFLSCGRLEEISRRTVHDLFKSFAPLTSTSAQQWVANYIKAKTVRVVVAVMEGGGADMMAGADSDVKSAAADSALKQRLWVPSTDDWVRSNRLMIWFNCLGTALDAYRFLLEPTPPVLANRWRSLLSLARCVLTVLMCVVYQLLPVMYVQAGVSNIFTSGKVKTEDKDGADGANSNLLPAIQAFLNKVNRALKLARAVSWADSSLLASGSVQRAGNSAAEPVAHSSQWS
jgi:hypothetical protein